MAKFCANCGNKLEDEASVCLKCGVLVNNVNGSVTKNVSNVGSAKKKKGLPVWAIVLIILGCILLIPIIVLIIFGAAIFKFISSVDGKNYVNDVRNGIYENIYGEEKVIGEGTISDTLEIDGMKLTLTEASSYSEIEGEYLTKTPISGFEYLVFFFDVENISDEEKMIAWLNFNGSVDGVDTNSQILFSEVNGVNSLNGSLGASEKMAGYVAFEVPKDWKSFDLYYGNIIQDEKIIFHVSNANNNSSL